MNASFGHPGKPRWRWSRFQRADHLACSPGLRHLQNELPGYSPRKSDRVRRTRPPLRSRSQIAKDGLRLARRFRGHQDMILRFATDLTVGFTSNEAERGVRPVKVQQRTSGGCWRTLQGLADYAIVQSYLSTATKWGIDALDALTQLFTTGPWLPPAIRPG